MKKLFDKRSWTSLAALVLLLLFAGAADGLMGCLGVVGFAITGITTVGVASALVEQARGVGQ